MATRPQYPDCNIDADERERERERERRKGEKREREEFIFLNGVKQHILFNFLHGLKCYRFVFFKVKTSSF
jgi:hypothetical protein